MSSRDAILQRLRHRTGGELTAPECDFSVLDRPEWSTAEKLDMFERTIESVHGEVHRTTEAGWIDRLAEVLQTRGAQTLLIAKENEIGKALQSATKGREDLPQLLIYDEPVEIWQGSLFSEVDAGITSTRGGIAETGSLILWPTVDEPRLMSLVPPIHIAVLKASELYTTFHQAMQSQNWAAGMPTNALLISGPSKTADIEQTLAYGVHGPKELIVLVIE
ncbi:MAG: lactate utilization protein [Marinobacter sp.]|uniref:LutC/YkgG family protein n=1 Tax=Marinobacter sp. TaxID=50741 RepID=UPI003299B08B